MTDVYVDNLYGRVDQLLESGKISQDEADEFADRIRALESDLNDVSGRESEQ